MQGVATSRLPRGGLAVEVGRPLLLVALFVVASLHGSWWLSAPLALAAVFASSILVHDLIHGNLGLPPSVNEVALSLGALLLVKSGHGLRALHLAHHRHCLEDGDVEGRVAHESFASLVVRGPLLALTSRVEAFRAEPRTRRIQLFETALNAAILAAAFWSFAATRSSAILVYWACVVLVTVTAPIWGAKIPHMIPPSHPVVRRLARLTGRMTPAAASVLLHELHHRFPRVPVSMLPANAHLLDTSAPSPCAEVARSPRG
jgi:fatty acid desaturase